MELRYIFANYLNFPERNFSFPEIFSEQIMFPTFLMGENLALAYTYLNLLIPKICHLNIPVTEKKTGRKMDLEKLFWEKQGMHRVTLASWSRKKNSNYKMRQDWLSNQFSNFFGDLGFNNCTKPPNLNNWAFESTCITLHDFCKMTNHLLRS